MANIQVRKALTVQDFEQGKVLFEEYAGTLNFDLGYQDFKKELDTLGEQYSAPEGTLLLCFTAEGHIVGCAGVRRFSVGIAELKRLYVRPDYRKLNIGKQLLAAAIDTAKQLHYRYIRLDTVPGQEKAQDLYRYLGFYEITPYRYSPVKGTIFMEKRLDEI